MLSSLASAVLFSPSHCFFFSSAAVLLFSSAPELQVVTGVLGTILPVTFPPAALFSEALVFGQTSISAETLISVMTLVRLAFLVQETGDCLKEEASLVTLDKSPVVTGRGVTVKPGFSADELSTSVLTGKLTTVFLPLVYTIVRLVCQAMAWPCGSFFPTKKKHPAVIYMANLALADLLSVTWFPLKIAYHIHGNNWIYGESLLQGAHWLFYGNMYCSILFMTCLSVQRYWVIVNPMVHPKKQANMLMCASLGIWLLILLLTIPLYAVKQTFLHPGP